MRMYLAKLKLKFEDILIESNTEVKFLGFFEELKFENVKIKDTSRLKIELDSINILNLEKLYIKKNSSLLIKIKNSNSSCNLKLNETTISEKSYVKMKGNFNKFLILNVKTEEDSFIEIRNIKTNKLLIGKLYFYKGKWKFFKVNVRKSLGICESNLTEFQFIDCNFNEAKIYIKDSDLTEAKFLDIDWGNISEERICSNFFKRNPKKARDIYKQLKVTLDKHGDIINANKFYTLEMKAYEEELQNKRDAFQERVVFTIHKWASDFGQSWTKPLMWIIVFGLLFTGIKYLHKENIPYKFLPEEIKIVFDTTATVLNEFTKSLIPLFSDKKEIEGLEFISFIFSIIIAFLTYQFIVAVRRKVKR